MFNKTYLDRGVRPSEIRRLFEYAKKRKKEIGEEKVFDFSIGNPSFKTPDEVTNTLIDLIKNTDPVTLHGYSSSSGYDEVKEVIAHNLKEKYQADIDPKLMYLTCGAAASLTIVLNALINDGDEIIIFSPYFPDYPIFISTARGKTIVCEPDKETFQPDFKKLKKLINKNTKAILIDSPNNPSGVLYTTETIKKLSELLKKKEQEYHHSIYLISDEPYRELLYDDKLYPFVTNYYDDSIICYSYSKALSLPGERIGYIAIGNKCNKKVDLFNAICGSGRSLGYICAPVLFQRLIEKVDHLKVDISLYQANRDFMYNELTKIGYEIIKPDGAFYMFMKSLDKDEKEFLNKAMEEEILFVPSEPFGIKGYVRIAYCVRKETIEKSLPAFRRLYYKYQGARNE